MSLGFCAVGIADAGRPWGADRFEEWLEAGMDADMGWLRARRAERLDPSLLNPGARSVIVVGADYHHGPDGRLPLGAGRVARYAHGRDYHNVLGRRLLKLRRFVAQELPGARVYKSTDTGAVLERSWAVASGVASMGKSGNVLREVEGSWLLLGVLIVDRALPPDAPSPDLCGECTACMEACPTAAIVAPGLVDARRCVSYLTIEHRGPLPPPRRAPGAERLTETDEQFHAHFWGSPIRRVGGESMRRNAAYRLGVEGRPSALATLTNSLRSDPSEVVRGAAAWALGRVGGAAARTALDRRRGSEAAPTVRREIDDALAR